MPSSSFVEAFFENLRFLIAFIGYLLSKAKKKKKLTGKLCNPDVLYLERSVVLL
jgi:hypothetical protein